MMRSFIFAPREAEVEVVSSAQLPVENWDVLKLLIQSLKRQIE